jgi:hypothetical protein
MAVVLNSEDGSYFGQGSWQRSHSQTHFGGGSRSSYQSSASKINQSYRPSISESYSDSIPSSTSSSPRTTHAEASDLFYASTPASTSSIASDFEDTLATDRVQEEQLTYYKQQHGLYIRPPTSPDDNLEPSPSPKLATHTRHPPSVMAVSATRHRSQIPPNFPSTLRMTRP